MSISLCVFRSKRHKSGSIEEEADSPGGEYYHSPSSPASSSRNWTDDMEGGKTTISTFLFTVMLLNRLGPGLLIHCTITKGFLAFKKILLVIMKRAQ